MSSYEINYKQKNLEELTEMSIMVGDKEGIKKF